MAEGSTVSGTALQQVLARSGPLNPAWAVAVVRQVAAVLDGTPADRAVRQEPISSADILLTGGAVQLVESGASADPRADSYALAGVLFECLTGTPPHPPVSRPSQLQPSIPAALDVVIARGLATEPAARYPTAAALAAAAEQALGVPAEPQPAPRLTRLRAFGVVLAGLAITGVLVGAMWAWIAPPVHGVVALTRDGERVHGYLGNEWDHFFVAAFLVLGLLGAAAVVAAVLVWQWRAYRGPGMMIALALGLTVTAVLAVTVGALLVRVRYGVLDIDAVPVSDQHRAHYFTEAPPVFFGHTAWQITATLLLPGAVAGLVYGLCAAANARDDLGGYPAIEPSAALLTVTGAAPSNP